MEAQKGIKEEVYHFIKGGGEMGALTRAFNWSKTSVGSPDKWPQSLRITLSILLSSKFPMFLWWGDDLVQFYNDAYRPSLGNNGKHPTALGQKGKDCWPEIWDIIYPLIYQVRTTGEATWSEDQLVPIYRNGKIEDVYWTFGYSPIRGESDIIEGVLVVCTETTEKVLNAKKIAQSEKNFRNIVLQAPVAMCILTGPNHVIKVVNDKVLKLWDRAEEEVMNKPLFEALPDVKEQGLEELLAEVYTTSKPFKATEMPVDILRNGKIETVYLDFVYEPYKDIDEQVVGILVICIDVTSQAQARRKIEDVVSERTKELDVANKNLQKSNSDLAQFAYIASHDLQEPVRKVNTFVQMLGNYLGDDIDERAKNYMARIKNSSERMLALIRDVLAYSELSQINRSYKTVELQEVVEEIKTDYELVIEQKKAVVHASGLPVIEAIPLHMTQLFSNLISNALKFSKQDAQPEIKITAFPLPLSEIKEHLTLKAETPYYRIDITDNGIGFKQNQSSRIFNIFQRLHGKTAYEGTGIGLALCQKIVHNHHGEIYATSESGKGSTFTVILPVTQGNTVKREQYS